MAGKIEKSKGKVKQAVGALTGNKKLESEGRIDHRTGEAKEKIGRLTRKFEEAAETTQRKAVKVVDNAKDVALPK
ncbi:MAG: CsbD family protein [Acidimicrobiaceae bacterium]|nr:CsbD family protein [Acidimicrobiaceae bacterium]